MWSLASFGLFLSEKYGRSSKKFSQPLMPKYFDPAMNENGWKEKYKGARLCQPDTCVGCLQPVSILPDQHWVLHPLPCREKDFLKRYALMAGARLVQHKRWKEISLDLTALKEGIRNPSVCLFWLLLDQKGWLGSKELWGSWAFRE